MGYQITVASEVGKGSTFTIHLTERVAGEGAEDLGGLDDPPIARWAPIHGDPTLEFRGKTVLVVDDESDSRTLLQDSLEDLGFRVLTAKDGVHGIETARVERPDLVTVDLMMPRMGGWDVLKAMSRDPLLRETPAVVVSVVAEEEAGTLPVSVDVLRKPIGRDDLLRVLRRNLSPESGRVLVIEGHPDTSLRLQRYLREAGLLTYAAPDAASAAALLRRAMVDLILLDLLMPVSEAVETLGELRSESSEQAVPIVVLTGRALAAEETDALGGWSNEVIEKGPSTEKQLREILDRHFRKAEEVRGA
jgi:CheY-like chemotaxis protein